MSELSEREKFLFAYCLIEHMDLETRPREDAPKREPRETE